MIRRPPRSTPFPTRRSSDLAPPTTSIEPFAPDQVAVPLLFSVRTESSTFEDAGKLIPAFALVVAFVPETQVIPLSVEHIVPPVQFRAPFRSTSPAPANVPPVWEN